MVETMDGARQYRISALHPDEFAPTLDAYGDGATLRVLVKQQNGRWSTVPRPIEDDLA